MVAEASSFSAEALLARLQAAGCHYGQPLSAVRQTTSTNDDALAALKAGAPSGAVFVTDQQTNGRGRHGRQWFSAAGESLTFSLVLRPNIAPSKLSTLTLVVGLAVHDALSREVTHSLKIKWPNDIVLKRHKLAGILLEKPQLEAQDTAVVVGVGVNVGKGSIPSELSETTTALAALAPRVPALEPLLASILQRIEIRVAEFEQRGFPALAAKIRAHDALLGQTIFVDNKSGIASGISDDGELLLKSGHQMLRLNAGTVTFDPA